MDIELTLQSLAESQSKMAAHLVALAQSQKHLFDSQQRVVDTQQRIVDSQERILDSHQLILDSHRRIVETAQPLIEWQERFLESQRWMADAFQQLMKSQQALTEAHLAVEANLASLIDAQKATERKLEAFLNHVEEGRGSYARSEEHSAESSE